MKNLLVLLMLGLMVGGSWAIPGDAIYDDYWRGPNCKESYYSDSVGYTTAAYYSPIWKDGVNINPDRNTTTFVRYCHNCGKRWVIILGYDYYDYKEVSREAEVFSFMEAHQ